VMYMLLSNSTYRHAIIIGNDLSSDIDIDLPVDTSIDS
jgi:hypothetical protein